MRLLSNVLMMMVGLMVLWSLIGISSIQVEGQKHYSFFIKSTPSTQVLFTQK